jgi:hypothetical protein
MIASATAFQRAIQAFEKAKIERAKQWPKAMWLFRKAFMRARSERALYTPYLNVLDIFGLKTRELCHSRVLAWFLDENASHEQGNRFLRCLANRVSLDIVGPANYHVQREKPDHVDVAVFKKDNFAIFIENKVEHRETKKQVGDLIDALIRFGDSHRVPNESRIAIFLTDHGRKPTTAPKVMPTGFIQQNLWPIKRVSLFTDFVESLANEPKKSGLLAALLGAYVTGISNHRGS